MRRIALALASAGVLTVTSPAVAAPPTPADETAIRAVLDHLSAAWNRHDMDAFVAETTPDVDWVNVVGMHWEGRDAVRRAHIAFHKGMFAQSTLSPPQHLQMRALGPDVALVTYESRIEGVGLTPGGTPYPSDGAVMSMVLVKTTQGWRIAHAHNTNINAQARAHDPARAPDLAQDPARAPG